VRYAKTTLLLLAFFVAGLTSTAGAQEAVEVEIASPPESCDDCHNGEADEDWMGSPEELLADSIHSDEECDSCHVDISMEDLDLEAENPHVDEMEPVDCGGCHEDEAVIYQKHGRLTVGRIQTCPSAGIATAATTSSRRPTRRNRPARPMPARSSCLPGTMNRCARAACSRCFSAWIRKRRANSRRVCARNRVAERRNQTDTGVVNAAGQVHAIAALGEGS